MCPAITILLIHHLTLTFCTVIHNTFGIIKADKQIWEYLSFSHHHHNLLPNIRISRSSKMSTYSGNPPDPPASASVPQKTSPISSIKATLTHTFKSQPKNPKSIPSYPSSSSSKRSVIPRAPPSLPLLPALSSQELDAYCDKIIALLQETDLDQLFNQVIAADLKGHLTDSLYAQWIDFFYCFIPMVLAAPNGDPIIVDQANLQSHEAILKLFEKGVPFEGKGGNQVHNWYFFFPPHFLVFMCICLLIKKTPS